MSKVFKVWCDSGANIHSCWEDKYSLEDLGLTNEEWEDMTEDEKDRFMQDIAFDRLDWGYAEVTE
jgi:hypothetical protein